MTNNSLPKILFASNLINRRKGYGLAAFWVFVSECIEIKLCSVFKSRTIQFLQKLSGHNSLLISFVIHIFVNYNENFVVKRLNSRPLHAFFYTYHVFKFGLSQAVARNLWNYLLLEEKCHWFWYNILTNTSILFLNIQHSVRKGKQIIIWSIKNNRYKTLCTILQKKKNYFTKLISIVW